MKQIHIKSIVLFFPGFFLGFILLNSCTDAFLKTPEAQLKILIKNDNDELEEPETIYAGKTKLYFANEGVSFFSVVYPGDKEELETIVDENGDTITVWKVNHDYEDINNADYIDKNGKRAVTGISLSYQDNYNMFLSQSWFRYPDPGEYKIYLEAINTNEKGEVTTNTSSMIITVLAEE